MTTGTNLSRAEIATKILRELYIRKNQLAEMVMKDRPTLAVLTKVPNAGDRYRKVPVKYRQGGGRSASFTAARGGRVGSKWEAFEVQSANDFAVGGIEGDAMDDNMSSPEKLVDLLRDEMDSCIERVSEDIGMKLFRNSGGARGRIATGGISSATVTLDDPEDIVHFEVADLIVFSSADGSTATDTLRGGGAALEIQSIDRNLGTITFTANVSTVSGVVVQDYLFTEGDFQANILGFDAWCPASAPGGTDSFAGVNRSVDTRLSGIRYTASGQPIEEAWQNAAARARRFRSSLKMGICNPMRWNELNLALGNKRDYVDVEGKGDAAGIGFSAIKLATPAGTIKILEDPNCQVDVGWMIDPDLWYVDHVGESLVRILRADGSDMLRDEGSDAYEWRVKARYRMYTTDPSKTVRIQFA